MARVDLGDGRYADVDATRDGIDVRFADATGTRGGFLAPFEGSEEALNEEVKAHWPDAWVPPEFKKGGFHEGGIEPGVENLWHSVVGEVEKVRSDRRVRLATEEAQRVAAAGNQPVPTESNESAPAGETSPGGANSGS